MQPFRCPTLLIVAVLLGGCSRSNGAAADAGEDRSAVSGESWSSYLAAIAQAERIDDPVQRCLAYPDLPDNQWPAGSAKARCPLLRTATPTLEDIEAVLGQTDGALKLDRQFAELLDAHYKDPNRREAIFLAYQAFTGSDVSRRIVETWHMRAPDSAFAQMALGQEMISRAGDARGSDAFVDTPEQDIQIMQRLIGQAAPLLQSALAAEPRLSPACVDLMFVGRVSGDDVIRDTATAHCLKVDPLSWNVRFEWQLGLDPRWGGSLEALDESVEAIRPHVRMNPALGGLLARGIGIRAYLPLLAGHPSQETAQGFETASRIAPDPLFIGNAGLAAKERGESTKALGYLSQALRLAPKNSRFLGARSEVRNNLADFEGSIADARRAIELDDRVGKFHSTLGLALNKLGRNEEAREAFAAAMQYPVQRQWAFRRWCETFILHNLMPEEALACTDGLVNEFPDDAQALFMRSWVLYEVGDTRADAMAVRFHAEADERNPRHREMISELARLTNNKRKQTK